MDWQVNVLYSISTGSIETPGLSTSFAHYSAVIWCETADSLFCSAGGGCCNPSSWDSSKFHSLFIMVLSHNWKIVWKRNNRFSQQEHFLHRFAPTLIESSALIAFSATVFDPAWPRATGLFCRKRRENIQYILSQMSPGATGSSCVAKEPCPPDVTVATG